ncbi:MAG: amidohydrolase family protein, partial [Oleiphilaceae bacterium]|nr:amidohydrolase family protein [Oleiphilaceae bacterium]
ACAEAIQRLIQAKVPLEQVTLSSDAHASLPRFNAQGVLEGLQVGDPASLWRAVVSAVSEHHLPLERVLPLVTSNPARITGLRESGSLHVGRSADLVMVDRASLDIHSVMTQGQWRLREGILTAKGAFE